jgi:signal transduction histidine kinase
MSTGIAVLYVDDESKALHYFREAFEDEFPIYTANNAADGYAQLIQHGAEIGVLITDQSMPGEKGVELLEKARRLYPNLIRILVTAYTDYKVAVDAVNEGRIYRYVHKPWDPEELSRIIHQARSDYQTLRERELLLGEQVQSLRHMVMADKVAGLGILAEGLNHHMRNALAVIRAFVELAPLKLCEELQRQPVDMAFWGEMHSQTQQQIDRIQLVLARLGEASSISEIQREDHVHLPSLLEEITQLYRPTFEHHGVILSYAVDPAVPIMMVNGARLAQLWRLIFADQLTHLGSGDAVHIDASLSKMSNGAAAVRFVISDTGNWTEDDDVANLFDPFFVRSHQPMELGVNLTACYVIVHHHAGQISARLRKPKGLDIDILLPVDPSMMPQPNDRLEERLLDHQNRWMSREV